jgi:DNA-binding NarL/FixJ family response regulator
MSVNENAVITPLTPTEQRVLAEVAKGLSNAAVAVALDISTRTVESHVSNMLSKTGFKNRTQLAHWHLTTSTIYSLDN